jgi:hypothetical protein
MRSDRRASNLDLLKMICFVMAFHPNCTRCCPVDFDSCQCEWAWEDCPQQTGCNDCGGNDCNGTSTSGLNALPIDASPRGQSATQRAFAIDAAEEIDPSGTLAFVTTSSGTFAVASVTANDDVRIVRVDANALDEDPLTVRAIRDVALSPGDAPGRVISDGRGHAIVALRGGGALVTIDPLDASVVVRRDACDAPRDLAVNGDVIHVACASGDVIDIAADGTRTKRASLGVALDSVASLGDGLVASGGSRMFVVTAEGVVTSRRASGVVGALRASSDQIVAAVGSDLGPLTIDGISKTRTAPSTIADVSLDGDATAIVAADDAFLRTGDTDFARISGPGITRAVALADVRGENLVRHVLATQTQKPRMLVVYALPNTQSPIALEPLE